MSKVKETPEAVAVKDVAEKKPASHGHGGGHGHSKPHSGKPNPRTLAKRGLKKFHLPVIGHFADKSVEFKTIIDAEKATGISYQMIFEACVGKIFKAKDVIWEFKKGNHYIKYKAFYINAQDSFKKSEKEK